MYTKARTFCAKCCRNFALFNLNTLLIWGGWVILSYGF
jgi:hypothetical protein